MNLIKQNNYQANPIPEAAPEPAKPMK